MARRDNLHSPKTLALGIVLISLLSLCAACSPSAILDPYELLEEAPSVTITVNPSQSGYGGSSDILEGNTAIAHGDNSYWSVDSWQWSQVNGPAVELVGASSQSVSFVAPQVDQDSEITLRVTATNDKGSSEAQAVITIRETTSQIATPIAGASYSLSSYTSTSTAEVDSTVTLEGDAHPQGSDSNSYSYYDNGVTYDDYVTYSYSWRQIEGPTVSLTSLNTQNPSFVVPALPHPVAAVFELSVFDSFGRTASTTVSVNLGEINEPDADASGPAMAMQPFATATLSSGAYGYYAAPATGPDAGLTFRWTQTAGPTAMIDDVSASTVNIIAPCVTSDKTLQFTLTVTDRLGRSDTTTVNVQVQPAPLPTVSAGSDQIYELYEPYGHTSTQPPPIITLEGSAYDGSSSSNLTYVWEKIDGPGDVTVETANEANAYFVPDDDTWGTKSGTYVFRLTVTDRCGVSVTDFVNVTIYP